MLLDHVNQAVLTYDCDRACPQQDVVDYCTNKGIVLTAYSPLGSENSPLLKNPVVQKLAEKHEVQPANILISLQANRPNVAGEDTSLLEFKEVG